MKLVFSINEQELLKAAKNGGTVVERLKQTEEFLLSSVGGGQLISKLVAFGVLLVVDEFGVIFPPDRLRNAVIDLDNMPLSEDVANEIVSTRRRNG